MRIRYLPAIVAATLLAASVSANGAQERYERKSVSFLNALLVTNRSLQFSGEEVEHLLDAVRESLSLERFDYNPLPEPLVRDFIAQANSRDRLSMEELNGLMTETIVPAIDSLIQTNLESRAAGLVSQDEASSWIATKAKSLGITSVELEKVLNAGYIYFPVITDIRRKKEENRIVVDISGTVLWYRVLLASGVPEIKLVSGLGKAGTSRGFGRADRALAYDGEPLDGATYAFFAAADNFARNMETAMREMPDFQLAGFVRETGGETVSFDMGTKEGIRLDDRFFVVERVEDEKGGRDEKVGLIRVTKIGFTGLTERESSVERAGLMSENRVRSYSTGRRIIGGGFGEGMRTVEYPRLPLDVAIGLHSFRLKFGKSGPTDDYIIRTDKEQDKQSIGIRLAALYNTARWSGVSQLFILLEGGIGMVDFEGEDKLGGEIPAATYSTVSLGMLKRYYYRRAAIPLKAEFGLQSVEAKGWYSSIPGDNDDELIRIRNMAIGLTVGTGFELTVTPSTTIQAAVDYRLFSVSRQWDLVVDSDVAIPFAGPSVRASGMNFGLAMVYSPPRLQFDPINLVKVALGI